MSHPIRFRCPGCNALIKAPRQILGQSRDCPGCGRNFVVRFEKPHDSDPCLVPGNWAARPDGGGR